ncbi:MAG: response regulator transcription factor [Pseudonocardia sp.]
MRLVIADDSGIFRRGLRRLLEAAGHDVAADAADVPALLDAVEAHRPDACLLDVRMPPTFSDEGVRAAEEIRRRHPTIGLLLLSTYAETAWAERLLDDEGGVGYLLKDRVDDVAELVGALRRVAAGGTALDPEIVASLVRRRRLAGRLDALTDRERRVLELMARGMSNAGIGRDLFVSGKTVETYAAAVFQKLGLSGERADRDRNRRVLAVLAYLQHAA